MSKESDRIATSCYTTGGGYTDVTVTSANQIADRLNWKSTISTYTDLGSDLPQNALFSIRKKTVDGKPVVTLVYRDAFRDDVLNGIRLLSPDSKLTPAQRDLLKLKDCKSFPLTDFQTLTSSPGSTNYDAILSTIKLDPAFASAEMGEVATSSALVVFLFTLFYMVLVTLVVDTINIQNKKVELQIMTHDYNLSNVVLSNIPHGCTILDAKGGYTGKPMYVIYMSVRKKEAKKVVKVCRKVDPKVFINVIPMEQIYGRFYRKPIK